MKVTGNALKILKKRYFTKGETWEKVCDRVAYKVASAEKKAKDREKWRA